MELIQQITLLPLRFDWVLFLLPLPFLAGMLIDTLIWKQVLLRQYRLSFRSVFAAYAGGEAVLLSLPGGFALADAIKSAWAVHKFNAAPSHAVAGLAARHWLLALTQMIYVLAVCCVGFFALHNHDFNRFSGTGMILPGLITVVLVCVVLFFFTRMLFRGTLLQRIWKIFYRLPSHKLQRWFHRYDAFILETDRQFLFIGKTSGWSIAAMLAGYFMYWSVEAFESIVVAHVLGFSIGVLEALMIEALLSVVKLGMFFLPSGVGAKDAGYIALFTVFGIQTGNAGMAAFILLKRFVLSVFIILGYGYLSADGLNMIRYRRFSWKAITEH